MKLNAYVASVLVLAGVGVASQPAFSQGAMGPGGAPMAPQPRVAPAPQAPVIAPQAPVVVPQSPMAIPNPANPSAPSPRQNKEASSQAIFDRWGSSFASSTNFAPLPKAGVTSSGGGASVSTQTNDKGIFTVGAGQNGQETRGYPITSITISLPANPDANMKTPPPVLVGLGLSTKPFTIKGTEQQAIGRRVEIAHVFPGSVLGKTLSIKVMMPQGSGDATVDWGDGSPPTNIREGKPVAGTVAASDPAIVGVVNLLKAP